MTWVSRVPGTFGSVGEIIDAVAGELADEGGEARLSHKNPDGNCSTIRAPKILTWHPQWLTKRVTVASK
jgi:hypothetical protein